MRTSRTPHFAESSQESCISCRHDSGYPVPSMWDPSQPIEGRRPDRFRPLFCPRKDCPDHRFQGRGYRAKRDGSYRRKCDPQRRIPRFVCRTCGRGFSRQTFATSHYMKRPELLAPVAGMLVACAAHRQIARHLDCAPSTVTQISVRLGNHAQRFHEQAMTRLQEIAEPVVLDHFETFVRSQQERLGIATPVGHRSWFVYGLEGARYLGTTRRSRRKRALKSSPQPTIPGAITESTRKTLRFLLSKVSDELELISDDHPAYPAAIRHLDRQLGGSSRIRHRVFPNPDRSPDGDKSLALARDRAMFPVDLLHKLLRHSQSHHRRETIAFGRKTANVMGRTAVFALWRNFIKRVSERRPAAITPAMRVGLTSKPWTWLDVLAERMFPGRVCLDAG